MRIPCHVLAGLALLLSATPAAAQPAPTIGGGWQPGPGAVGDNTYSGFIDNPAGGASVVPAAAVLVNGWFVDTTAEGWAGADDVQVFSGQMGAGGTLLGKGLVGQSRPDVAAVLNNPYWSSAGWSASVAAPAGGGALNVYLHTPAKGWWFKQITVTAAGQASATRTAGGPPINVIVEPRAAQNLGTETDFEVRGYALDPAAAPNQGSQGTGIDQVQIYLNGPRGDPGSSFLGNAKLAYSDATAAAQYGPQFSVAGWRFPLHTTGLHANAYTLYVYAHSAVTGQETLTRVGFQIVEGRV
jgi:hypothetical protein